ncbi:MAG: hypothetical protein IJ228_08145 [Succinivibrio sp.]|nr:hypothetical protein [Succinivibrio sp.]
MATEDTFADAPVCTPEKRSHMLRLLSTNIYDIEENCRFEKLPEFKTTYLLSRQRLEECLKLLVQWIF